MALFIGLAKSEDILFAATLSSWYKKSSEERGTGIAVRTEEYISRKILKGKSIIAKEGDEVIGFCYIEDFEKKQYVSNSGLIVKSSHRGQGIAKKIKIAAFQLAMTKYPNAKIFGITTSDVVMKINSELGYIPVPLFKLTQDEEFWNGCKTCRNYEVLKHNEKRLCLCTGMLSPSKNELLEKENHSHDVNKK